MLSSSPALLLNIGCGRRFSRDPRWNNIDLVPSAPEVSAVDVSMGLPFERDSFHAVYHSHVLEHLDRISGKKFLADCFRVIKPNGILRVVVPDLERIAIGYLEQLVEARSSRLGADRRYEWAMLEMCDQMVRSASGGEMLAFLSEREPYGRKYAEERCGAETRFIVETIDQERQIAVAETKSKFRLQSLTQKVRSWTIRLLIGKEALAVQAGRFEISGEKHRWMYDSFSISEVLKAVGFSKIAVCNSIHSRIEDWGSFALDADLCGVTYKPDSLFVEAVKP